MYYLTGEELVIPLYKPVFQMSEQPHKNLEDWKKNIELIQIFFKILEDFPVDEKYGIISQFKRAAISVPVNISEGAARRTEKELYQFLCIAAGSSSDD